MHACIHACIHTYIHTYIQTYRRTRTRVQSAWTPKDTIAVQLRECPLVPSAAQRDASGTRPARPCHAETQATCKETLQCAAKPLEQVATTTRARATFERFEMAFLHFLLVLPSFIWAQTVKATANANMRTTGKQQTRTHAD